ncbi:hypothetical protein [Faecalibaculum rodentium]|uniref:hypothetical protein n=1 Tax=Faecalibaculum rodentium TaxID=1702221 RepID=UPI00256F550A|nr:hypothetical protein [Faecalibaculum rodentium]
MSLKTAEAFPDGFTIRKKTVWPGLEQRSCIWSCQEIPVTVRIIQYADGGQMHLSLQQNAEGWFITDFFEGTSRGYGNKKFRPESSWKN